jgi:hypothetical protein
MVKPLKSVVATAANEAAIKSAFQVSRAFSFTTCHTFSSSQTVAGHTGMAGRYSMKSGVLRSQ